MRIQTGSIEEPGRQEEPGSLQVKEGRSEVSSRRTDRRTVKWTHRTRRQAWEQLQAEHRTLQTWILQLQAAGAGIRTDLPRERQERARTTQRVRPPRALWQRECRKL